MPVTLGTAVPGDHVMLRRFPKQEGGNVIALFPYQLESLYSCNSYQHVGQHCAVSHALINDTKPAWLEDEDVQALLTELRSIGYAPAIIKRTNRKLLEKARAEFSQWDREQHAACA